MATPLPSHQCTASGSDMATLAASIFAACGQQAALGGALARGVPRVPSLVFDLELEERSDGPLRGDHEHVGVKELKRWLLPSSTGEYKLRNDVEMGLAHYQHQHRAQPAAVATPLERNQALARFLTRLGYRVHIRTALGGGEGFECLRNLRHVFLAVLPPGAHATTNRFVVDLSFQEQFRIAKPTPRYAALLACVPDTYVAPEASVAPLVNFMCHEMALAFGATGVVLPPWRATHSMLSKWLPRKSLDEQVPRPSNTASATPGVTAAAPPSALHSIAAASNVPRRSMDISGHVHGHWVATNATAANGQQPRHHQAAMAHAVRAAVAADTDRAAPLVALASRLSAGLVKPMSCEPQRVVVGGNFSSIGFT